MSKFENEQNDKEIVLEKADGPEKDAETSKDELKEAGEARAKKTLDEINSSIEQARDSIGDNPELEAKIDKLAGEAKSEISALAGDFESNLEKEGFGDALITNPKILDLIAEIEYCHVEDQEMKEQLIQNWKRMIEGQYNEALEDYDEDPEYSQGLIYGNGGWDRFKVINGEVQLTNNPGANLNANTTALQRAKELGMKINES